MKPLERVRGWFTEARASSENYTTQRLAATLQAASGFDGVRATACYQAALNLIESSVAIAELTGEFSAVLEEHVGSIARSLTDRGESTWLIEVDTEGRMVLVPCSISNVYGTATPATWTYSVMRAGPSETLTVDRPAASLLSFRTHVDPKRPWRGRPALEASNSTGALLSSLETQLASESRFKPARAVSAGVTSQQRSGVSDALAAGGVVTISGGSLVGHDSAGALKSGVIRNETSTPVGNLHGELSRLVFGALGVPPDLLMGGSEAGARESFRRFSVSNIVPTLTIIKREWESKVGPLDFSLDELRAGDISARARAVGSRSAAFKNLVSGGVGVERALLLAGLDD